MPAVARWPASKQLPASAADHSHQRPRWLEQTGLIRGRSMGFRTIAGAGTGVARRQFSLIFPAGILPA